MWKATLKTSLLLHAACRHAAMTTETPSEAARAKEKLAFSSCTAPFSPASPRSLSVAISDELLVG